MLPPGLPTRAARPALTLGLGLALAACSLAPGQGPRTPRRTTAPDRTVAAASPSVAPAASAQPDAASSTAQLALNLPARLGLALPASLVGAQARVGLTGGDGKVGFQGSQLVALADGRIVSNNSGALISDAGGNLISDHGSGLISDAGGGVISNNSGALIGNNSSGWRHLLAEGDEVIGTEEDPLDDPRLHLWLVLTLIDLNDQVLMGFLEAKPVLGQWRRFASNGVRVLPPPVLADLFGPVLKGMLAQLNGLHFAGHLAQEGGQARLRVVVLPSAEAPISEGYPLLDMSASGPNEAVARTRFIRDMEGQFGLDGSAARVTVRQGPEGRALVLDVAEHHLPPDRREGLALLLTGKNPMVAGRRHLVLNAPKGTKNSGVMGSTSLTNPKAGLSQQDFYVGMGYAAPGAEDPGLAFFNLRRFGLAGALGPSVWSVPFTKDDPPGSGPPAINYLNLAGQYLRNPGASLAALTPSYSPGDERVIPRAILAGEDPTQDPALRPEALTEALIQAPISP